MSDSAPHAPHMPHANGTRKEQAAWAGVILTLVFGIGAAVQTAVGNSLALLRRDLTAVQERELVALKDRALQAFEEGRRAANIAQNSDRISSLDLNLQREMRDVNATTEAKLAGLDTRLQGEIKTVAELQLEMVKRLRETMDEMRLWQIEGVREAAEHKAAIEALKRADDANGHR